MKSVGVRVPVVYGMNLDDDSSSARGSRINYNIRSVTDDGQTSFSTYIVRGNELVYEAPAPVAQNLRIRIQRTDETIATGYTGTVVFAPDLTFPISFDWATLQADIEADLDASIGAFTVTTFFSNSSYYDINIAYNIGTGFPMTFVPDPTPDFTVTVLLEPISAQLASPYYCIGSYDLLGDLFLWLTNKAGEELFVGNVSAITNTGTGLEQVTIVAHGLSTGDYVRLDDLGGVGNINNGIYWVRRIDADTIEIAVNYSGAYTSGGVAYTQVKGVSEIGVAQKDSQTEDWAYTMLLRSLELNFDRAHCMDMDGEFENNQYSLYYTDNLNRIRLFYYLGDFTDAGAFRYYGALDRPQGLYYLDTVDEQSSLLPIFSKEGINFVTQDDIGGALKSGNHRYAYRLISDGLAATEWTYLSKDVPVYPPSQSVYLELLGGAEDQDTTKINVLSVTFTDDIPSIFKYIQWAYVRFEGDTFTGGIFSRETLQSGVLTYTLRHTGSETTEALDTAVLGIQFGTYDAAKNIRILDNRLVLSNLRSSYNNLDLSDYLSSATYEVAKRTFSGVTSNTGGGKPIGATSYVNMYQKVENVYNYTGYMQHETYDFYAAPEYFNGHIGIPQHLSEVLFEATALTSFNDWRISSVFLTGNDVSVFVPYVEWTLPAGSFLVDGKMVSSFIRRFHIYRAERKRPSILGNGIAILGVDNAFEDAVVPAPAEYGRIAKLEYIDSASAAQSLGEFPFVVGNSATDVQTGSALVPIPYPSAGGDTDNFTATSLYVAFYFPDDIVNYPAISNKTITPATSGDTIYNHGQPDVFVQTFPRGGFDLDQHTIDVSGTVTDIATPPDQIIVEEGSTARVNDFTVGGVTWSRTLHAVINATVVPAVPVVEDNYYYNSPSCVLKLDAVPDTISGATDYGLRVFYYKREVTNQYNQLTDELVPTGAQVNISETAAAAVDVFGGDVFTQECYLQWRTVEAANNIRGWGAGIRFFSQNTHNWQLRNNDEGNQERQWPVMPAGEGINEWLDAARWQLFYQNGYDIKNPINVARGFDPSLDYNEDLRATFIWSDLKPQGSKEDRYRSFPILNRKSLESKYGEIIHHEVINGELFSVQLRKFMRHFFNTTGQLQTVGAGEVVIGDGGVMQREGITISGYGGKNKFGIVKGRSKGGDDTLYVPDQENAIIWRFGADGLVPISIREKIHSFLKANFKWVNQDAPVNDAGMCGVWNEQHKEYILTVRFRRDLDYEIWQEGVEYSIGTIVLYQDPTLFNDFDFNGQRLFEALINPNVDIQPTSDPLVWQIIDLDDARYYNLFTIVYSELEDKFKCLLTPHPRLYLKFKNVYLTQNPYSLGFYENNRGDYGVWWDDGADVLEAAGYYSPVVNPEPDEVKQFENVQIRAEVVPYRVELTTQNKQTFMVANDFTFADEVGYQSPVKNDSTVTAENPSGLNDIDTSAMYGRTVDPLRIYFQSGVFQKISTLLLNVRMRFPTFKK